jgi:hypothetical protein
MSFASKEDVGTEDGYDVSVVQCYGTGVRMRADIKSCSGNCRPAPSYGCL